jgi:hypothetical protein
MRLHERTGQHRVLRGGYWDNNGRNCRSANRNGNEPGNRDNNVDFRPVLARSNHGKDRSTTPWNLSGRDRQTVDIIAECW